MTRATNQAYDEEHFIQLDVNISPKVIDVIGEAMANSLLKCFTREAKPFGTSQSNGRQATMTMMGTKSDVDILVAGLEQNRIKLQRAAQGCFNKSATSYNVGQVSVSGVITHPHATATQMTLHIGIAKPA